jgi:mannose-1-phosphate guanylyltransferase
MRLRQRTWAIVLAAGDGTRLARLTTDASGHAVPKQFCSLNGGPSLLDEALDRARQIAPRDRVCVIVAEQHRQHWCRALWALPSNNIIVQPANRGTAHGILLCVLSILERDPLARIVFLPADHYVRDELALQTSQRQAATLLTGNSGGMVLIGIEPEEPDPELGYIVPGHTLRDGSRTVQRFVEKPDPILARQLLSAGALWNSFIFAASGPALLGMMRARLGGVVEDMATALARDARSGGRSIALTGLYDELSSADFSRSVLQGAEETLQVIAAPACGWTDLGTPDRVAETLRRLEDDYLYRLPRKRAIYSALTSSASINLAASPIRLDRVEGALS